MSDEIVKLTNETKEQLTRIVSRIENLNEQIEDLKGDAKDVFDEAKSLGFDTKVIRQVIKRRKADRSQLETLETLVEVYEEAICHYMEQG